MKSIAKIAATALLLAGATFAQEGPKFGAHLGLGLTGFNGSDAEDVDAGFGFAVGGEMVMPLAPSMSLAPELLFSYRTASASTSFMGVSIDMDQTEMAIDVPVLVRYNLMPALFVQAGPQLNYVLSSETEISIADSSKTVDALDSRNQLEVGLAAGVGYQVTPQIFVDLRYMYGFTKAQNDDDLEEDETAANSTPYQLMLGASYQF